MLIRNKHTKTKPEPKSTFNFIRTADVCITVSTCRTQHRTVLIIFPSYPPDGHHSSGDVYWRGGGFFREYYYVDARAIVLYAVHITESVFVSHEAVIISHVAVDGLVFTPRRIYRCGLSLQRIARSVGLSRSWVLN